RIGGLPRGLGLAGAAAGVAVGVGATAWLLAEADRATSDRAQARIDAIRTGLSAGAGAGGGLVLLLAARRQWLGERTQAHAEDDATERRGPQPCTQAGPPPRPPKAAGPPP